MRLSLLVLFLILCTYLGAEAHGQNNSRKDATITEKKAIPILVVSDVYFAFDTDNIILRYRRDLAEVAEGIRLFSRAYPSTDLLIVIEGHTDSIGSHNYNLDLAERRALAAVYVLGKGGIPRDLIRVVSKGESDPKAANGTEEGRANNRRVVIYLVGDHDSVDYVLKRYHNDPDPETFDGFGEMIP